MYIVEGNIGVGKSSFLERIKKNLPEIDTLTEPKDNWTAQIYGQSLLENFYKNPKRWAYTLETLAMICRSRDHVEQQNKLDTRVVFERSIYSGHYCFATNGKDNGFLSNIEWDIYNKWASFLINQQCKPPRGFIYLKASPQVCLDRIKKRNRISEKSITLAYIKQISSYHEKFLIKKEGISDNIKHIPVLVLDCNQDFINDEQNLQKHLVILKNFIDKTEANASFIPAQSAKEFEKSQI